MTKTIRFTETSNRDGSVTVYGNGKKLLRGSRAEVDAFCASYRTAGFAAPAADTSSLTDLEYRTMDLYAHCEMNSTNGATPTKASDVWTYLWADERSAELDISEKALGGVLSSLVKKGFIKVAPQCPKDPDGGVTFTEEGFAAWKARHG